MRDLEMVMEEDELDNSRQHQPYWGPWRMCGPGFGENVVSCGLLLTQHRHFTD